MHHSAHRIAADFETPFSGTSVRELQGRSAGGGAAGGGTSVRPTQFQSVAGQSSIAVIPPPPPPPPILREEFVNDDADVEFGFRANDDGSFNPDNDARAKEFFEELIGPHFFQTGWASPMLLAERIFHENILPYFLFCARSTNNAAACNPPYSFHLYKGIGDMQSAWKIAASAAAPRLSNIPCIPNLSGGAVSGASSGQPPQIFSADNNFDLQATPAQEKQLRESFHNKAVRGFQALIILFPRQHLGHALDLLSGVNIGANANTGSSSRGRGRYSVIQQQQQQQQQQQDFPIKIKCSTGESRDRVYVVNNYVVSGGKHCTCPAFTHAVLTSASFATCKHVLALNLAFGFCVPANPPAPPILFDQYWNKLPPTPQLEQEEPLASLQGGFLPLNEEEEDGEGNSNASQKKKNAGHEEELPLFDLEDSQTTKQQQQQHGHADAIVDSSDTGGGSPQLYRPGQVICHCGGGSLDHMTVYGPTLAWIAATEQEVQNMLSG